MLVVLPMPNHSRNSGTSADLGSELRKGRQAEQVVCQPGCEDEGAAGIDPDESLVRVKRARGDGGPESGAEAREDADATEHRRERLVPPVG